MTDLPKHVRDMSDAEAAEALRQIERDDFRRLFERRPPDDLKDRFAASLSPKEMDRYRQAMGLDRSHWSFVDQEQAHFEKDPAALARRDADIERAAALRAARGDQS